MPASPESSPAEPVRAAGTTGEVYLGQLAQFGAELARSEPGSAAFLAGPLNLIRQAMGFTLGVIYRVAGAQDRRLVLEVAGILDPAGRRPELVRRARFALDLDRPDPKFANEVQAFASRGVAAINVPGVGCDIAGHVAAGETECEAYLLAGDFVGAEAGLQPADVRLFEIACGLLSAVLTKAHFQQRADRDPLTGLLSAARIRSELERIWKSGSEGAGRGVAVALADIDDFKRINDCHGHLAGDAVLKEMGRLVAANFRRRHDHAGRYGGDEFLLLLEDIAPERVGAALERLRAAVEQHPFVQPATGAAATGGAQLAPTMSIGACVLPVPDPRRPAADALAEADRALYAAKRAGRNRVVVRGCDPLKDANRDAAH